MELDFSNWPIWAILVLLLATNQHVLKALDKIISLIFGVSLKHGEAEMEADRWQRNRAEWREDKFFDLFEGMLEEYRKESKEQGSVLRELISALNRNTNTIGQQTSQLNILSQNTARLTDKVENMSSTRYVRRDETKD